MKTISLIFGIILLVQTTAFAKAPRCSELFRLNPIDLYLGSGKGDFRKRKPKSIPWRENGEIKDDIFELFTTLTATDIATLTKSDPRLFAQFYKDLAIYLNTGGGKAKVARYNNEVYIGHFLTALSVKANKWMPLVSKKTLSDIMDGMSPIFLRSLGREGVGFENFIPNAFPALIQRIGAKDPFVSKVYERALDNLYGLPIAVHAPKIAKNIRAKYLQTWFIDPPNKAITIPAIRESPGEHMHMYCGTCKYMAWGHYGAYTKKHQGRDSAIITYRGEVIGIQKTVSDNNFVALRNVKNDKGELILIAGGVYLPPRFILKNLKTRVGIFGEDGLRLPHQKLELTDVLSGNESNLYFFPKIYLKSPRESTYMKNAKLYNFIRREYGLRAGKNGYVNGDIFRNHFNRLRDRVLQMHEAGQIGESQ